MVFLWLTLTLHDDIGMCFCVCILCLFGRHWPLLKVKYMDNIPECYESFQPSGVFILHYLC